MPPTDQPARWTGLQRRSFNRHVVAGQRARLSGIAAWGQAGCLQTVNPARRRNPPHQHAGNPQANAPAGWMTKKRRFRPGSPSAPAGSPDPARHHAAPVHQRLRQRNQNRLFKDGLPGSQPFRSQSPAPNRGRKHAARAKKSKTEELQDPWRRPLPAVSSQRIRRASMTRNSGSGRAFGPAAIRGDRQPPSENLSRGPL